MAIIHLQGEKEKREGYYYEFDTASKPLGEGGMGKVYRGRRVSTHTGETRDVAIKFMFAGLPPNVIQRAENEANIRIVHENLVEMMGFLTIETTLANGAKALHYHVVSELLQGVSLSDLLQGNVTDQEGYPIPYAQNLYDLYRTDPAQFAVTVTKKVLSGIMALHDAGYIHRDIDPSNIMITRDGKIKLIDFGIAKKVDGLKTVDRNLTSAGQFMGKPQYAAPELIMGDLKHQNKPTDIYAIGIMLFQLAVGHLPFDGPSNVVINAHLQKKLPLSQIADKRLRYIVDRATVKDCTKRYQSAAEFRAALDNLSFDGGSASPLAGKLPLLAGVAAAAVGLLVGLVLLWPSGSKSGQRETDDTAAAVDTAAAPAARGIDGVHRQLLDPAQAAAGFEALKRMAGEGSPEALFTLSQLHAVSFGTFTVGDQFVTMKANLKGAVATDGKKANQLLKQAIQANPDYYPALYELACHYYEPQLSGGGPQDLVKAKQLLDLALEKAQKAEDPVYVNKINAMLSKY
ncbi:MAG: protein kinase [Alloprevotella sp.]